MSLFKIPWTKFLGKRNKKPACIAPWVHSFLYPSGERMLCCASDIISGCQDYSEKEFWNSSPMRKIRRTMLKGEFPKECKACKMQRTPLYSYFNSVFSDDLPELMKATSLWGTLKKSPISFDHRTTNKCNFKCRMCSSRLSSSWRAENLSVLGDYALPKWLRDPNYQQMQDRLEYSSTKEILESIEKKTLREIYWAGGEPLLIDFHWKTMKSVIDADLAKNVLIRYNTNLSSLSYQGKHLFQDILSHFPRYQIFVSIDAIESIGEYLRTGLNWNKFKKNLEESILYTDGMDRVLKIDLTLTLPGILDLENLLEFAINYDLEIVTKSVNTSDFHELIDPLSVHSLPSSLFFRFLEETRGKIQRLRNPKNESVFHELEFIEQQGPWEPKITSLEYSKGLRAGISRLLDLEERRKFAPISLEEIFNRRPYLGEWLRTHLPEKHYD